MDWHEGGLDVVGLVGLLGHRVLGQCTLGGEKVGEGLCPRTQRVEGREGGFLELKELKGGERPKPRVREVEARGVRPSKEEGEVSRLCSCHG